MINDGAKVAPRKQNCSRERGYLWRIVGGISRPLSRATRRDHKVWAHTPAQPMEQTRRARRCLKLGGGAILPHGPQSSWSARSKYGSMLSTQRLA